MVWCGADCRVYFLCPVFSMSEGFPIFPPLSFHPRSCLLPMYHIIPTRYFYRHRLPVHPSPSPFCRYRKPIFPPLTFHPRSCLLPMYHIIPTRYFYRYRLPIHPSPSLFCRYRKPMFSLFPIYPPASCGYTATRYFSP